MKIDEAHNLEDMLKEELERVDPKNPALKYYDSTWKAINAYEKALAKLRGKMK